MRALAKIEAMRARELEGELISRAVVADVFATLASVTKSRVLGIAPSCARLVTGQTDHSKVYKTIDGASRRSLGEIASFDPSKIRGKKAARSGQKNGGDDDDDDDQS
jgi:hypothetical protein